jgi:hypothetical protein
LFFGVHQINPYSFEIVTADPIFLQEKSIIYGVEQASGLLFRASRPKPLQDGQTLHACPTACNLRRATEFGGTPNSTRETRVLP